MPYSLLLTSFDIWLPHHVSNAADDLLLALADRNLMPDSAHLLRKLPVDFELAPRQVIAAIEQLQPDAILCCGMAESRTDLTLELNAQCSTERLQTRIDLKQLLTEAQVTSISEDAGSFVCNHLYYSVLKYLQESASGCLCIFVHVPVLNPGNVGAIVQDFTLILNALQQVNFTPATSHGAILA